MLVTKTIYASKEGQGEIEKTSSFTQVRCDSQMGLLVTI